MNYKYPSTRDTMFLSLYYIGMPRREAMPLIKVSQDWLHFFSSIFKVIVSILFQGQTHDDGLVSTTIQRHTLCA
jgi:hypothetical protein